MFLNDAVYFMDDLSETVGVYTYTSNIQYSTSKYSKHKYTIRET